MWHKKQGKMQSFGDRENSRMNDFGPKHSTPVKTRTYQQQPLPEYGSPSPMHTANKNSSKTALNKSAPQWEAQCKVQDYSDEYSSPDNSPKSTTKGAPQHPHQETKDTVERGRLHSLQTAYNTPQNRYTGNSDNDKGYTVLQKQSGTWFVSPKGMFGQISGDGKAVTNISSVLSDTIAWSPGSTAAFLEQDIINKQRHEMQILMEELGIRDQELNDLVSSHQKQVQAWEAEREKFSMLHSRLRGYEEELIKNDKQLKETLKEMALVNEQREADSLEFKRTQDEMEKLAERISENSHYIKEMENKSLKNTIKELMAEQAEKEKREHELLKTIEDKDNQVTDKKVEMNQLKDHIKYVESRCEELEEKNLNMASEMSSWKRKYCQAKDEADKFLALNTEKEESNQKMTLQLQESLQQAVALQKALFTSCEREKCKEEVMYSLRKQHKRTMQELQNIRELYDRQNRDLTLYHLSVKEKIEMETAKKESGQGQADKPEIKDGGLVAKHLKGDKNMSSHKDPVSNSTQESEESATYLIKNKKCRQEASQEEVTEDAESTPCQAEACGRRSRTTRCYNVATTTSSTTQLSEDRDSSIPRSRPSTSLGISKTSTWGSCSIQNSSLYSGSRSIRSCSDPRPSRQKRSTRSKTTSPILTRYPFACRRRARSRRRSRDKVEARTEESCSSPGSHLLSPSHFDDSLSPADSDGMCQELKRDITQICFEAFDISPSTEKSKPEPGAKPSSLKQLPTAMSNPLRSSFLKKEKVEKRISFSAEDDDITATTTPSLSKKSLELPTRKDQWSRACLHPEAQGDYMLSPSAIENECSHNSPLVEWHDKEDTAYCKQIKHCCVGKTHCHNHCKSKSEKKKMCHCKADKKSDCRLRPHKPCSEYCKCLGYKISPPSPQLPEQRLCKKTPGETKTSVIDTKPPSQKGQKTPERNPFKSSSNPNPRVKQPKDDQNLSTNGNPNSPSMEDQESRNSHSEDHPVIKSHAPNQKKALPPTDKRATSSPEPTLTTEPHTSSRKSFLETYHPSFHGLRRSIIDFIYPSSENGNNKEEKEKKSPGTVVKASDQWNLSESENDPSTSQTKSYQSGTEQDEHSDKKRKYSEKTNSSVHEKTTTSDNSYEVPAASDSIKREPFMSQTKSYQSGTEQDELSDKKRKYSEKKHSSVYEKTTRGNSYEVPAGSDSIKREPSAANDSDRYEQSATAINSRSRASSQPGSGGQSTMERKPSSNARNTLLIPPVRDSFSGKRPSELIKDRKASDAIVEKAHYSELNATESQEPRKTIYQEEETIFMKDLKPNEKSELEMQTHKSKIADEKSSMFFVDRPTLRPGELEEEIITFSDHRQTKRSEDQIVNKRKISFVEHKSSVPGISKPASRDSNTSPFVTRSPTIKRFSSIKEDEGLRSENSWNKPSSKEFVSLSVPASRVSEKRISSNSSANTPVITVEEDTVYIEMPSENGQEKKIFSFSNKGVNVTPTNTPHSLSNITPGHTPRILGSITPRSLSIVTPANTPHRLSYDEGDHFNENLEDDDSMPGKVSRALSCNMENPSENGKRSSFLSHPDTNLDNTPGKISRAVSCNVGTRSETGKRSTFVSYPVEDPDDMPSKVSRAVSCNVGEPTKSENTPKGLSSFNIEGVPSKMSRAVTCDILESPRTGQMSSKYSFPDKGIDVGLDRMSRNYDDMIKSWIPDHEDLTKKKRSWKSPSHRSNQEVTYIKSESPKHGQCSKICRSGSPILKISPVKYVDCSPHREKIKSRSSPPLSGFFLKKNKKMKITVQYSDDECIDSTDESCMPETSFSVQDDSDESPERPCSSHNKRDKHKRCNSRTSHFLKNKSEPFKHHGIYSCKDKGLRPDREIGFSERMSRVCGKTSPMKEERFSFQKILQRNMGDSFWGHQKSLCDLLSDTGDKDFFEGGTGFPPFKYNGPRVDPFLGQPMYGRKSSASYLPADVGVYLSQNRKLYCNNNKSQDMHCGEVPDEPSGSWLMIDKLDLDTGVDCLPCTKDNFDEVTTQSSGHTESSANGINLRDGLDGQTQQVEGKEVERNYFYTEVTSSNCSLGKGVITEEAKKGPGKAQPTKPFTTIRGPSLYKQLSQIHFSEKSNRYEWVDGTERSMNGCINLASAAKPPCLPDPRMDSEIDQRLHFELLAGSEKCDKSLDSGHHSLSGGFLDGIAIGCASNNNNNLKLSDDSCVNSPAASILFACQPPMARRESQAGGSFDRLGGHLVLDPIVRRLNFDDTSSLTDDLASPELDRTFRFDHKENDAFESDCGHDRKKEERGIPFSSFAKSPLDHICLKCTNLQREQGTFPAHLQCDTKDCNRNVNSSEISEASHPSLADYFKDISTLIVDDSNQEKSVLINDEAEDNVKAKSCINTTDLVPEAHKKVDEKIMSSLVPELPAHEFITFHTQAGKDEFVQDRLLGKWCENFPEDHRNLVFHKWPEILVKMVDGRPVADKNVSVKLLLEATSSNKSSAANETAVLRQDLGTKVPDWLEDEIAELPDNLFGREPPSAGRRDSSGAPFSLWNDHLRSQISPSTRLHKLLIQSQQMIHLLEHSSAVPETIKLEVSMSYKS